MRGIRNAARPRRLWVESLESRVTPTALPVPPMPPQPVEVVVFVGPAMPRITLPIEIRIEIETEKSVPAKNPTSDATVAAESIASFSASTIAAALRQAVHVTAQATPTFQRVESAPVFPVETKLPTDASLTANAVPTEEIAALVARMGSAAEPTPADLVFHFVGPAHVAYWQRPVVTQGAAPEAVRGDTAPAMPEAEVAPAEPMARPAAPPAAAPQSESRETHRSSEFETSLTRPKETKTANMGWAGLVFFGWLKKPKQKKTAPKRRGSRLAWLWPRESCK
ncbi:MAG: hypothetical protein U0744_01030 [Gemmataceae bacterium]